MSSKNRKKTYNVVTGPAASEKRYKVNSSGSQAGKTNSNVYTGPVVKKDWKNADTRNVVVKKAGVNILDELQRQREERERIRRQGAENVAQQIRMQSHGTGNTKTGMAAINSLFDKYKHVGKVKATVDTEKRDMLRGQQASEQAGWASQNINAGTVRYKNPGRDVEGAERNFDTGELIDPRAQREKTPGNTGRPRVYGATETPARSAGASGQNQGVRQVLDMLSRANVAGKDPFDPSYYATPGRKRTNGVLKYGEDSFAARSAEAQLENPNSYLNKVHRWKSQAPSPTGNLRQDAIGEAEYQNQGRSLRMYDQDPEADISLKSDDWLTSRRAQVQRDLESKQAQIPQTAEELQGLREENQAITDRKSRYRTFYNKSTNDPELAQILDGRPADYASSHDRENYYDALLYDYIHGNDTEGVNAGQKPSKRWKSSGSASRTAPSRIWPTRTRG